MYDVTQFNTKQDYLEYRTKWKLDYAKLSDQIRNIKRGIASDAKANIYVGEKQAHRISLAHQATFQLENLANAKENAQSSYLHFLSAEPALRRMA